MNAQPLRSKSSLYFERYAFAERRSMALGLTVYLLGAVCIVLAAGLVVVLIRPRPIHYIAPATAAATGGVSYPGKVPSASAASFATAWLMNWVNYTPQTADEVYARSLGVMAPGLLAKITTGLEEELAKIRRERISSSFSLSDDPKVLEELRGFAVVFTGERAIYVGKEEMLSEKVRFIVEVRPCPLTEGAPYGLMVHDVRKERVMDAAH